MDNQRSRRNPSNVPQRIPNLPHPHPEPPALPHPAPLPDVVWKARVCSRSLLPPIHTPLLLTTRPICVFESDSGCVYEGGGVGGECAQRTEMGEGGRERVSKGQRVCVCVCVCVFSLGSVISRRSHRTHVSVCNTLAEGPPKDNTSKRVGRGPCWCIVACPCPATKLPRTTLSTPPLPVREKERACKRTRERGRERECVYFCSCVCVCETVCGVHVHVFMSDSMCVCVCVCVCTHISKPVCYI